MSAGSSRFIITQSVVIPVVTHPVEDGIIRRAVVQLQGDTGFVVVSDAQHGRHPFKIDETLVFPSDAEGNVTSFTEIWGARETRLEEVLERLEQGVTPFCWGE